MTVKMCFLVIRLPGDTQIHYEVLCRQQFLIVKVKKFCLDSS